jgi:hypothetical protein
MLQECWGPRLDYTISTGHHWKKQEILRVYRAYHPCLTMSLRCLRTIEPDWFSIIYNDLESGS